MTSEQLEDMTGYKNHQAQANWLSENGYYFDRAASGRPNVLIEQVRERQLRRPVANDCKPGPDFSWLDRAG